MLDNPILILEYDEDEITFEPPYPDEEMYDKERERLDEELFEMIDSGAFDPSHEVIEPA